MYRLAVLPTPPKSFFKKYNGIVSNFLWNGKRPKVRLTLLQGIKLQGGAGLVNLENKEKALKLQWVQKVNLDAKLMSRAQCILGDHLGDSVWQVNLIGKDLRTFIQHLNPNSFWLSALVTWTSI